MTEKPNINIIEKRYSTTTNQLGLEDYCKKIILNQLEEYSNNGYTKFLFKEVEIFDGVANIVFWYANCSIPINLIGELACVMYIKNIKYNIATLSFDNCYNQSKTILVYLAEKDYIEELDIATLQII